MAGTASNEDSEDEALKLYQQCHLSSPDSLRLLKLDLRLCNKANISCSLETFVLLEAPLYTALSYTWDCPYANEDVIDPDFWTENNHCITCNGFVLDIRRNLFLALQKLASLGLDGYLWIDALCINQLNVVERGQQVDRMDRIFSRAQRVVAWIGEDLGEFQDFIWIHTELLSSLAKKLGGKLDLDTPLSNSNSILGGRDLQLLGLDDMERLGRNYGRVLKRGWFSRAWVAQEVALSEDLDILCGDFLLPWSSVLKFDHFRLSLVVGGVWHKFIDAHLRELSRADTDTAWKSFGFLRKIVHRPETILEVYKTQGIGSEAALRTTVLVKLAEISRGLECKDPRDKIFSLIGIVNRILPGNRFMKANYSLTLNGVLTETISRCLTSNRTLDCLISREDSSFRNLVDLPSWVFDFTSSCRQHYIVPTLDFVACGVDTLEEHAHTVHGNFLHVSAIKLDNLMFTNTQSLPDDVADLEKLSEYWVRNLELCHRLDTTYHTGETRLEVFWRTLIWNTVQLQDRRSAFVRASTEFETDFKKFMLMQLVSCCFYSVFRHQKEILDKDFMGALSGAFRQDFWVLDSLCDSRETQILPNVDEVAALASSVWLHDNQNKALPASLYEPSAGFIARTLLARRLLFTCKGFLAMGPISAAASDEVWILKGGRTPFVLRPGACDGSYTLIGPVYVHGFMHGEFRRLETCDAFSMIRIS